MDGLRGAIHRSDLPTPAQVLALRSDGRRHPLAFPVLEGLELIAPDEFSRLDVDRIRLAIAFLLAERPNFPEPGWLGLLVESHPNLAADEIVRFATMELRRASATSLRLRNVRQRMAVGGGSDSMSKATQRLPRTCAAALVRRTEPAALVRHRQPGRLDDGVDRHQKARCEEHDRDSARVLARCATDCFGAADLNVVEGFARQHENSMAGFFAFFERSFTRRLLFDRLPSPSLGRLAGLLGADHRPLSAIRSEPMKFRESDFVRILMEALGTHTDDGAVSALADLASNAGLAVWHSVIRRAQHEQRVLRRDIRYRHPDIDAVRQALERRRPANAGDPRTPPIWPR